MSKEAKTTLTSEGNLPSLTRRDLNGILDYLDECHRYKFSGHNAMSLNRFISDDLYREMIKDLPEIVSSKEFQEIKRITFFKTNKDYVYSIDFIREGSSLSTMKKVIKELLLTKSHLNDLSGKKVRRSVNDYCYTIIIDCNDGGYPSYGIHRLARLLYAFNGRKNFQ